MSRREDYGRKASRDSNTRLGLGPCWLRSCPAANPGTLPRSYAGIWNCTTPRFLGCPWVSDLLWPCRVPDHGGATRTLDHSRQLPFKSEVRVGADYIGRYFSLWQHRGSIPSASCEQCLTLQAFGTRKRDAGDLHEGYGHCDCSRLRFADFLWHLERLQDSPRHDRPYQLRAMSDIAICRQPACCSGLLVACGQLYIRILRLKLRTD